MASLAWGLASKPANAEAIPGAGVGATAATCHMGTQAPASAPAEKQKVIKGASKDQRKIKIRDIYKRFDRFEETFS